MAAGLVPVSERKQQLHDTELILSISSYKFVPNDASRLLELLALFFVFLWWCNGGLGMLVRARISDSGYYSG